MTDEISKAASVMGKKGGAKTALLGHDFYKKIGKQAAQKRWGKKLKAEQNVVNVNQNQSVSPDS